MKTVKEITVKLENKPGTLSLVNELLAAEGISILAMAAQTSKEAGTVSLVVGDPARAENTLKAAGYDATQSEVLAVELPQHPGALNALLKPLRLAGVNIEHLYGGLDCRGAGGRTIMLIAVDDAAKASDILANEWIRMYGEELYDL